MPRSARTIRRNRLLADVTLLAVVTPVMKSGPGRRVSEHALDHGMVITCRVDVRGRRVFGLVVQGTPVLRLFEGETGDAIGFCHEGHWTFVVEALVAPWRDFLGERDSVKLAPARRAPSNRSPYSARGPAHAKAMSGPEIVLFLARCVASIGVGDPADGNVMDFASEYGGFHMRIIRTARDIILLVDGTDRTQLVGVLQRHDLDHPAEVKHRVASLWLRETLLHLSACAAEVDPADLIAFARAGA
jgi:hypothetical protein